MPYVSIVAEELNYEQKEKLIVEISNLVSEVAQVPIQAVMVNINELPESNIGFCGKPLDKFKAEMQKE